MASDHKWFEWLHDRGQLMEALALIAFGASIVYGFFEVAVRDRDKDKIQELTIRVDELTAELGAARRALASVPDQPSCDTEMQANEQQYQRQLAAIRSEMKDAQSEKDATTSELVECRNDLNRSDQNRKQLSQSLSEATAELEQLAVTDPVECRGAVEHLAALGAPDACPAPVLGSCPPCANPPVSPRELRVDDREAEIDKPSGITVSVHDADSQGCTFRVVDDRGNMKGAERAIASANIEAVSNGMSRRVILNKHDSFHCGFFIVDLDQR